MITNRDTGILGRWLKALFSRWRRKKPPSKKTWPTREEIERLPWFERVELDDIIVVADDQTARQAVADLLQEEVVGFDTESKPTFIKGHTSSGPHVAQFATLKRAYVFMLHHAQAREAVKILLASETPKKVGFGLQHDLRTIPIKLGVKPQGVLDLQTLFSAQGYGPSVGVKVAVALTLDRRFAKSKKSSTSNWMSHHLSPKQILYAANDAYAAIHVFRALSYESSSGAGRNSK